MAFLVHAPPRSNAPARARRPPAASVLLHGGATRALLFRDFRVATADRMQRTGHAADPSDAEHPGHARRAHALCQNTADRCNDLVHIIGSLPRSRRNVAAVPRRLHPQLDPPSTIVDAPLRGGIPNIEDICWNRSHRIRAMRRPRQSGNGDVRGTLTRAEMAVTTDIDSGMHGVRISTVRSEIKATLARTRVRRRAGPGAL
ncbi:hypothetical protein [Burkholderia sp. RF4-BP95]|uniref:hypothetical protein n=1 Tax=Burkholderia sp. RF4-BP95 TaxID=1637845 RepID=UPI0012E3E1CC|nr:hypothetical protein [Burkholderia sp. RF4-BP95]